MARCWLRLFFFLALLASEYLSVDRAGEECCLGFVSGVALGTELSAAILSIFSPQDVLEKRQDLTALPIAFRVSAQAARLRLRRTQRVQERLRRQTKCLQPPALIAVLLPAAQSRSVPASLQALRRWHFLVRLGLLAALRPQVGRVRRLQYPESDHWACGACE
jgi:hypothetical protein